MDSPLYRIGRNYPSRAVPANNVSGKAPARKVVTIPVHFVGSERIRSEPDAALKIQKLFRGYRVRKSVRRILGIRKEVDEIEKRVSTEEYKEVIRKESKERLKVNEMLMSLLFKLDSVNGVGAGVRDLRKTVIKKAIALQERVDSVASGQAAGNLTHGGPEAVDQAGEAQVDDSKPPEDAVENTDAADQTTEAVGDNCSNFEHVVDRLGNETNAVDQIREVAQDSLNSLEDVFDPMGEEAPCPSEVIAGDNMEKEDVEDDDNLEDNVSECGENVEMSQMESQAHSSSNLCPRVEEDEDENQEEDDIDDGHCDMVEKQEDGGVEKEVVTGAKERNSGEEKKEEGKRSRDREMLEKMVEDNGRMMELMAELFERNEIQTRILSSLSQRVELLERALMCAKLRRKKMKNNALVDCLESTQDSKKCGNK